MPEFKGKFTDVYLKALKSQATKNPPPKEYDLREGHGFGIRVRKTGIITFFYMYRFDDKRRFLNLGVYGPLPDTPLADARQKYAEAYALVKSGVDPQAPAPEPEPTPPEPEKLSVEKLKSKYVAHIKTHLVERSVKHQDERLEKHLIPVWGERAVSGIRRRDAIDLIETIAAKKPGAARNVLLAARAMFTYALRREMVEYNPFSEVGLAVPAATPNDRERTLSDDELKKVVLPYLLSPGGNTIVKNALMFILVTAQRPGEVAGMHVSEIDGDWWTIPWQRIKTECRKGKKNPRDHRVFLTPFAKSLILPSKDFIYPASRSAEGPVRTNTLAHHIQHYNPNYFGLPRWTPHDLRRTARTGMAALKVPERHAEAVLNHSLEGVKKIYDRHHYDKEKKAALTKWSNHLEKLKKEMTTQEQKHNV
ncbi:site-specific integrase [Geobacter sp. DSM 9736]|uniref:tyrosine-type recombinase/integrase n=1 Tax=Geobacter sp. DSM 9736 TaxID=1277350 RepID=UPI000B511086|nr:integrase arm-type DNA-binding domain-containing protein [Geobacter sp. DSM 9736]SNB45542.1 Site-specific recombinase XerD [Geobacter sp. DSM 9736]